MENCVEEKGFLVSLAIFTNAYSQVYSCGGGWGDLCWQGQEDLESVN